MDLLVDSHVLIWWQTAPEKLSKTAYSVLENPLNRVYFSFASVWEMQLKAGKHKLAFPYSIPLMIAGFESRTNCTLLPITLNHILGLSTLPDPLPHRDPFDHLLLVQARLERLVFVSKDRLSQDYPSLTILW